jgi:seryl-tRNA synthetase
MTMTPTSSTWVDYSLSDALSAPQAKALADKLVYSTETLLGLELDLDSRRIRLLLPENADRDGLSGLLKELTEEALAERVRDTRVVRRTESEIVVASPAKAADPATVALLHWAYDRLFRSLGAEFGALDRVYPAMIELAVMDRCRYVEMFPQNAYLVDDLPHERDALSRMRSGELDRDQIRRASPYLLNPALCFHAYEELAGSVHARPILLNTVGRCFRHEAPWRLGRFRLADFTMREIPFFGPAQEVESLREALLSKTWDLFVELGLRGRMETATDPFYHRQESRVRQHQLMANAKYELVVETPNGDSAAIASFNNLGDSLCREFDIKDENGAYAHSGCAAFGIDRWVRATLDKYGDKVGQLPGLLRGLCS